MAITDHITYSAADIQRYLEGRMLPAEMHALEKAALDDPFLADAIEGMQQSLGQPKAGQLHTDLRDLGRRLHERTKKEEQKNRVIAFRWWAIAAAAVVVIAAGIGVLRYTQSEQKAPTDTQVAQVEKLTTTDSPEAVAPPTAATTSAGSAAVAPAIVANDRSADRTTHKKAKADVPAIPQQAEMNTYAAEKEVKQEDMYVHKNKADEEVAAVKTELLKDGSTIALTPPDSSIVAGYAKKSVPAATAARQQPENYEQIVIQRSRRDSLQQGLLGKARDVAMNTSRKELSERQLTRELKRNPDALLSGFIKGRVSDQYNNPLYNAVVRVDDKQDFLTDKQGYFNIPVRDSVVNVAVAYNGYYTQNLQLQNHAGYSNNITLNQLGVKPPNPQLNARIKADTLTVTNSQVRMLYDDQAATFRAKGTWANDGYRNVLTQNASPESGWLQYHQYLDQNKKIPMGNTPVGNVVVSFEVNKRGALSDFKIEHSLGQVYDDEAIRLIKAGPSWKLAKGNKARATVIVNF